MPRPNTIDLLPSEIRDRARLTATGEDTANGYRTIPGIARPRP